MSDQPRTTRPSISKSGVFPRPVIEPEMHLDDSRPTILPEKRDAGGATTGNIQTVREGIDSSNEQSDDDRAARN